MKVHEVMTSRVESCHGGTDLAAAAMIMWRNDCGVVPVIEEDTRRAVGVITDRDICMAVATKHRPARDIVVAEVNSGVAIRCSEDDDVQVALQRMREHKIRRLVVVDEQGSLRGIVALNDLVRAAAAVPSRQAGSLRDEVFATLQGICEHCKSGEEQPAGSTTRVRKRDSRQPEPATR